MDTQGGDVFDQTVASVIKQTSDARQSKSNDKANVARQRSQIISCDALNSGVLTQKGFDGEGELISKIKSKEDQTTEKKDFDYNYCNISEEAASKISSPQLKPTQQAQITIFDWDNTLFCTSRFQVNNQAEVEVAKRLHGQILAKLDQQTALVLEEALKKKGS